MQYSQLKKLQAHLDLLKKNNFLLEKEIKALLSADIAFGRNFTYFKNQLNQLDDRLLAIENSRGNEGGYQYALKILEKGGSLEEVMTSCHLTRAEAELITNLQAYKSLVR